MLKKVLNVVLIPLKIIWAILSEIGGLVWIVIGSVSVLVLLTGFYMSAVNSYDIKEITVVDKHYAASEQHVSTGVDTNGKVVMSTSGSTEKFTLIAEDDTYSTNLSIWNKVKKGQSIKVEVNKLNHIKRLIE